MLEVQSTTQQQTTASAEIRTRTNLSLHHLLGACRSTRRIGEIEQEYKNRELGNFWDEIFQHALSVATLSVAAIESYANELYFEGEIIATAMNSTAAAVISELIDDKKILDKYRFALAIRAEKKLDTGQGAAQSVDSLIKLRNAVVHFRPEWFGDENGEHQKLSRMLNSKFNSSPYFPNESIFPRAWASHSFCCWAIRSTVRFLDDFSRDANIPNQLDQFRDRLREMSGTEI
jgi:hypothetical protein